jgi:tetratricopeptide (TPR) repeat protein
VKPALLVTSALGIAAVAGALAFQAAAREREYRLLLSGGDAAVAADQSFGAIENYSGAIALRPDSMLAHLRRGQTYRQRGDLGAAARDFRAAARLDPAATRPLEEWADVLYAQKRFRRAAEVYQSRLRLDERDAGVTFRLGLALFRNRDIDGTLTAIAQTLRLDPSHANARYLLGMCLRERGDVAGAVAAFEKAVERSPGMIPAREELADLYAATGRRNEELEQMQLIAALDRDHIGRQIAVGAAHARASRVARDTSRQERQANLAILTLGSVLERVPDNPVASRVLGEVWLDRAESGEDPADLRKAIETLERPAAIPGAPSVALASYGRALMLDHHLEAAEGVLAQAVSRFPVEPRAFLDYATAAEQRHHLDAARTALVEYSALVTGDADFAARALRIGKLSLQLDDPATAVAWLTRAEPLMNDDGRLYAALAAAQQRLGNLSAARAALSRGVEIAPNDPQLAAIARTLH